MEKHVSLREIAWTFFVIGITGFGGGLAIIALIQDCCVSRKKWLSLEEFSHGVAFGQILSAFAVNTSIFVGYRLRGVAGGLTAAAAFLAPSVTLVTVLAALYFRFRTVPSLQSALHGIGPVVVALIVSAAYTMAKGKVKSVETFLVAVAAIVLLLYAKLQVPLVLLAALGYGLVRQQFVRGGANEKA